MSESLTSDAVVSNDEYTKLLSPFISETLYFLFFLDKFERPYLNIMLLRIIRLGVNNVLRVAALCYK